MAAKAIYIHEGQKINATPGANIERNPANQPKASNGYRSRRRYQSRDVENHVAATARRESGHQAQRQEETTPRARGEGFASFNSQELKLQESHRFLHYHRVSPSIDEIR
jgi:hypothetical protein